MFAHMQDITIAHLMWYFLIYAFLGWCVEVVFCSVDTGKFVNRGFLNGPLCPIYGFGGVAMVILLTPVADGFILLYIASVVICSLLEWVAGFLLEKMFHTRWWDYSDEPFNIGGYICLKFSLAWGIAGVLLMKAIHPMIARLVGLIPNVLGWVLLGVLYAILLADVVVTVVAVRKLEGDLGEMTRLADEIHKGSEVMAERIGNTAIAFAKKVETLELDEKKQQFDERVATEKAKLTESIEEGRLRVESASAELREKLESVFDTGDAKERLSALADKGGRIRQRLFRAFPNMKNRDNAEALQEMKTRQNVPSRVRQAEGGAEKPENDPSTGDEP